MSRREPYYRHPTVTAVAHVLIDGRYAREGGVDLMKRCHRIRLEITGATREDYTRVGRALLRDGFVPDADGQLVIDIVAAVRASLDEHEAQEG